MVVVSCGREGQYRSGKEAGLEVDRSVVVNARMETAQKIFMRVVTVLSIKASIMVCGARLWNRARLQVPMQQGTIWNMRRYPLTLNFHGMGTALFAAGG